ncbi:MAG: hypothetical protein PHD79_11870 [Aliarcobacter sp.]|nr:hypothetical protein [Aliarcobacter sp.]
MPFRYSSAIILDLDLDVSMKYEEVYADFRGEQILKIYLNLQNYQQIKS